MTTDQLTPAEALMDTFLDELAKRIAAILSASNPDRLLTPEEAADQLRVSERHVRNLTAKLGGQPPKLASVKVEGSRRILQSDLDSYIARNRLASGSER